MLGHPLFCLESITNIIKRSQEHMGTIGDGCTEHAISRNLEKRVKLSKTGECGMHVFRDPIKLDRDGPSTPGTLI